MHEINLNNIQISDLELFLATAKYGSFTKAGEKMYMTQSWVSKRMGLLESDLGLSLFIRNNRKLTLTPAGRVLEKRLEGISEELMAAVSEAHKAQSGTAGSLSVGFLEWGQNPFMSNLGKFIDENPQISVDIYFQQFAALHDSIERDKLDLVLTTAYDSMEFSAEEYEILPIVKVQMLAYMSRKHPLASRESLHISELRPEEMLMLDPRSCPGYANYIATLFRDNNIRPLVSQYASNGRQHIGNIVLNRGILFASRSFLGTGFEEQIIGVPLEGIYTTIDAIWKRRNTTNVLLRCVQQLEQTEDF